MAKNDLLLKRENKAGTMLADWTMNHVKQRVPFDKAQGFSGMNAAQAYGNDFLFGIGYMDMSGI